jgi:Ca2+-binding RTX toxin-like protein
MATITGTNQSDNLLGTPDSDTIYGLAGDDTLNGAGGGADTMYGGPGNDVLVGRDGGDVMNGGDGRDTFFVGGSSTFSIVTAYGNAGNDTFQSISVFDPTRPAFDLGLELHGGLGNDRFKFTGNVQAVAMDGGAGDDRFSIDRMLSGTLTGGAGDDHFKVTFMLGEVSGGNGDDVISVGISESGHGAHLHGDNGDDVIAAGVGSSIIEGGAGDDRLSDGIDFSDLASVVDGGAGDDFLSSPGRDILLGGNGHDTLESGAFENTLTGGGGRDHFVYGDLVVLDNIRADTITDFGTGRDVLDVSRLLDRVGAPSDPFASGYLGFEVLDGDTRVLFDQDGGGDNFVVLAIVQNTTLSECSQGLLI